MCATRKEQTMQISKDLSAAALRGTGGAMQFKLY